jgi:transcriptional regulator with XRE-family HTH domain
MSTTGERVEQARKELKLNQSELAVKVDMTPAAIWQIEKGVRMPNAESLKKLSEALEVSSDWLLTGSEEQMPRWFKKIKEEEPKMVAMFRGIPNLTEEDKERLLDLWGRLNQDGK